MVLSKPTTGDVSAYNEIYINIESTDDSSNYINIAIGETGGASSQNDEDCTGKSSENCPRHPRTINKVSNKMNNIS